jgi:hypothetical protein
VSGALLLLSQYAFMAWCSVKHRDNFTFYHRSPVTPEIAYCSDNLPAVVLRYSMWICIVISAPCLTNDDYDPDMLEA